MADVGQLLFVHVLQQEVLGLTWRVGHRGVHVAHVVGEWPDVLVVVLGPAGEVLALREALAHATENGASLASRPLIALSRCGSELFLRHQLGHVVLLRTCLSHRIQYSAPRGSPSSIALPGSRSGVRRHRPTIASTSTARRSSRTIRTARSSAGRSATRCDRPDPFHAGGRGQRGEVDRRVVEVDPLRRLRLRATAHAGDGRWWSRSLP